MVQGKLALVTGGGGGIGQATSQALARDGANVVVADINSDSAEATLKTLTGSGHCSFRLDVTNEESVDNIFKSIIEKYKSPPTIIINCAGIFIHIPSFLDQSLEVMQRIFDVNFKGTFIVTQRACKELKKYQLPGSIVNIASVSAYGRRKHVSYASSKAAIVCFSKAVGQEMAEFGIRCNSVSPGGIDTQMLRSISKSTIDSLMDMCPAKRVGKPEEVAELILFLSSEKSSYITAANLDINGGI